jgi:hypothetical protein
MRIAIIDADLIARKRHRFPNLACMKLSGYHKERGDDVALKLDYDGLAEFDYVYVSAVFTNTKIPGDVLKGQNVGFGGTGFFYDKAPALPEEVEHHMPDYHLYDAWVQAQLSSGGKRAEYKYYMDYSIGFLTRGCFRKCVFCVNRNYNRVRIHSAFNEFFDPSRPKICFLDDNFFGCGEWKRILEEVKAAGRPIQFKQGLDERLLTDEKCAALFSGKYDGDYIFAFDNLADAALIERKIQLARKYSDAVFKFYCFTGFDRNGKWNADFWRQDIFDLLKRIEILMQNRCLPYVMRYERYSESPYRGMYITLARWCNQPSFFKKKTLREFAEMPGNNAARHYITVFEQLFPDSGRYYDLRFRMITAR